MSELTTAVALLEGRQAAILGGYSVHLGERLSADPGSVERAADNFSVGRVYRDLLVGMGASGELVDEMLARADTEARKMAEEITLRPCGADVVSVVDQELVDALAAMYRCGFCEALAIAHARAERQLPPAPPHRRDEGSLE